LRTISLGWLQTKILLVSASWVARITGVSHYRPATLVIVGFWWYWGLNSGPCTC
jgi:hypothetical protein